MLGMGGFGNLGLGGVSLLDNSSSTAPWQMLKTHLNLLNDEDGDISYVASGYAPLSVRLVQAAAYNCWHSSMSNGIKSKKFNFNMDGVMRLLPGPLIEFSQYPDVVDFDLSAALNRQQRHDEHVQLLNSTNNKVTASSDSNNNVHTFEKSNPVKKILMVYMIGGLTYLEISALRKLSNDPMFPYTIVMATTKVVNATTLLASLLDTSIRY